MVMRYLSGATGARRDRSVARQQALD
jgi:hypothetical protein